VFLRYGGEGGIQARLGSVRKLVRNLSGTTITVTDVQVTNLDLYSAGAVEE
jgi:hypothetical protein